MANRNDASQPAYASEERKEIQPLNDLPQRRGREEVISRITRNAENVEKTLDDGLSEREMGSSRYELIGLIVTVTSSRYFSTYGSLTSGHLGFVCFQGFSSLEPPFEVSLYSLHFSVHVSSVALKRIKVQQHRSY